MTDYVIIRQNEADKPDWVEIGLVEGASSARRAIRSENLGDGTYIAVPASFWKPLVVTVEQTTKITIT